MKVKYDKQISIEEKKKLTSNGRRQYGIKLGYGNFCRRIAFYRESCRRQVRKRFNLITINIKEQKKKKKVQKRVKFYF